MDVYLVPLGRARHELYCEVQDDAAAGDPAEEGVDETTFMGRWKKRGLEAMREAEHEWRERQAGRLDTPVGRWARAKARMRGWVAEKVAEQRLLWHLRKQTNCVLFHPSDIAAGAALALMREGLQRDYERHRRWLVVNILAFVASGLLAPIPGPNLLAYYFLFRLGGHYFSMKGARHGLDVVSWTPEPSHELRELGEIAALPAPERAERVRAIAKALRLEHLATFFNRLAPV